MSELLAQILNMSITASFVIATVIVLRLILKKAPKWIRCIMWGMVAVKLIIPFSFESKLSLVLNAQRIADTSQSSTDYIEAMINSTEAIQQIDLLSILSYVWIAGVVLMLGYMLFSYVHLCRKVREKVHLKENIFICDHIRSPFVLGMFAPKIYLLSSMTEQEAEYVIAHEKAHLKRHDNIWKPMAFILLSFYWFNPLCWLAYFLFNKDIELACDEKVIKGLDVKGKKAYSTALLLCSSGHNMVTSCPVAFGENNVKQRIKNVLKYKKPTGFIIATAIVLCVVVAVTFLTSPVTTEKNKPVPTNNSTQATEPETQLKVEATENTTEPATKESKPKEKKKSTQPVTEPTKVTEAETQAITQAEPETTAPTTANTPSREDSLVEIEPLPQIDPEEHLMSMDNGGYELTLNADGNNSKPNHTESDYIQWDIAP